MTPEQIIEQLNRILPGLENSSSAAEDAMIRVLPDVIAALSRAARIEAALAPLVQMASYLGEVADDDSREAWMPVRHLYAIRGALKGGGA